MSDHPTPRPPRHRSPTLLRHLGVVLVVKLLVLTALWWAFVRDQRVQVQADQPALPWLSADTPSAERKPHGQ